MKKRKIQLLHENQPVFLCPFMSFEEEGEKIAKLAFSEMIQELFQENTSLLSIVDAAAKTLDEKKKRLN